MKSSLQQRKRKAKNATNQEGLDRLWEKFEKYSENPNSKMRATIRKAIKSLQACEATIRTVKEAKTLHGIGDTLARVIIRTDESFARIGDSKIGKQNAERLGGQKLRRTLPPSLVTNEATTDKPFLSEKQTEYFKAVSASKSLLLPKDNWKVVLIVDGREHHSKRMIAKLEMSGVPSEVRQLPIGDMAWVAKSGSTEVMLGTIVERKEVRDLASSLFGTRYKEQRLRLQKCGLPQIFLLVEGDTKNVENCPHDTLQTAMMETRIELGFQVVQTKHLEDTVRFLKSVHRRILQRTFPVAFGDSVTSNLPTFSSPNARGLSRRKRMKRRHKDYRRSFEEMVFDHPPIPPLGSQRFITYHELKCKVSKDREEGTKTIHAIFCGMLKQIPKVSDSTVQTLVQAYPTPAALYHTLEDLADCEAKKILSDLGTNAKKVGGQRALQIYRTFMILGDDPIEHSPINQNMAKGKNDAPCKDCNVYLQDRVSSDRTPQSPPTKKLHYNEEPDPKKPIAEKKTNNFPSDNDVPEILRKPSREQYSSPSSNDSWDNLWQKMANKRKEVEITEHDILFTRKSGNNQLTTLDLEPKHKKEKIRHKECFSPLSHDSWDDFCQNMADEKGGESVTVDNLSVKKGWESQLNFNQKAVEQRKEKIDIIDITSSDEDDRKAQASRISSEQIYSYQSAIVRSSLKKYQTSPSLSQGSTSSNKFSPTINRNQQQQHEEKKKELCPRKAARSTCYVATEMDGNLLPRKRFDKFIKNQKSLIPLQRISASHDDENIANILPKNSEIIELLD